VCRYFEVRVLNVQPGNLDLGGVLELAKDVRGVPSVEDEGVRDCEVALCQLLEIVKTYLQNVFLFCIADSQKSFSANPLELNSRFPLGVTLVV